MRAFTDKITDKKAKITRRIAKEPLITCVLLLCSLLLSGCSEDAASSPNATGASQNAAEVSADSSEASPGEKTVAEKSAELIDISQYTLDAPFTDATWSTSVADLIAAKGEAAKSYDSVYGGTTYVFNTEYEGREGSVKYMFDDKNALMCVAFTYIPDNSDDVLSFYNEIHSSLVDSLGESGYATNQGTNYGDVWYRDEGDIIISCMITSEQNSLQFSYLNPIVSKFQMENAAAE